MTTTPLQLDLGPDVRERIEDAVIARLLPLRADRGGPCATVREYAGEFERLTEDASIDDIKRAVGGRVPALLVAAGSGRFDSISASRHRALGTLELEILHVAAGLRSREHRQRGSAGVYNTLRHVRELLHGIELNVDGAGPLSVLSEEPMLQHADLCVWKQTFTGKIALFNEQKTGPALGGLRALGYLAEVSGVGDSLAVAAGVVTLTDAAGGFARDLIGRTIVIAGATSAGNNGEFVVADVPDAGEGQQVTFANAAGVSEAFPGTWTIKRTTPVVTGDVTV